MIVMRPEVRRYIYGIIAAAMPLLAFMGIVGPDEVTLWLLLAAAVLGLGGGLLAIPNTSQASPGGTLDPLPQPKPSAPVVNVFPADGANMAQQAVQAAAEAQLQRDRVPGPDHRAPGDAL